VQPDLPEWHAFPNKKQATRSVACFGRRKLPNGTINALKFSLCDFYASIYPLRKKRIK
jgi:hypothetical protein